MGLDQKQWAFVELARQQIRRKKWTLEMALKIAGNTINAELLQDALEEKPAAPEVPKKSLWDEMSYEARSRSILECIEEGKTNREMAAEFGTHPSAIWNFCQKKRIKGDVRFVLPGTSQLGGKMAAVQNPQWGSGLYRK